MRNTTGTIISNQRIAEATFEMILQLPQAGECREGMQQIRPGQFINLKLEGFFLRRPISICDWDADELTITIIYKAVGRGTEAMSAMEEGEQLEILWSLGNGYGLEKLPAAPLLIGGGAGVPPMYGLCKVLIRAGVQPTVILGFRSAKDAFYREAFEQMGAHVVITTEDGSMGTEGFVTDAMKYLDYDCIYSCGPEPMLRAVSSAAPEEIPGQFSFEERMGCGFGACMGCSCKTKYGSKRICKDGPVLERSEIIW